MSREQKKLRVDFLIPALRERQDVDYFDRLPEEAQKYLKKFLEEIYGRKFDLKNGFGRKKKNRLAVYKETNEANNDVMHFLIRVDVDPTTVDLKVSHVQEAHRDTPAKPTYEIEKVYYENGIKITRYKTIKP